MRDDDFRQPDPPRFDAPGDYPSRTVVVDVATVADPDAWLADPGHVWVGDCYVWRRSRDYEFSRWWECEGPARDGWPGSDWGAGKACGSGILGRIARSRGIDRGYWLAQKAKEVEAYRRWLVEDPSDRHAAGTTLALRRRLWELRGKVLGCRCCDWAPGDPDPEVPCVAVVLARLADALPTAEGLPVVEDPDAPAAGTRLMVGGRQVAWALPPELVRWAQSEFVAT